MNTIHVSWDAGSPPSERNDCGVRALAIAFDIPYSSAYGILKELGRRKNCGTYKQAHMIPAIKKACLLRYGYSSVVNVARAGTVRKFLSKKGAKGRYIIWVSGHFTVVINGRIWDMLPGSRLIEKLERQRVKAAWRIA